MWALECKNHIVNTANENSAVRIIQKPPKLPPILNAVLMINIYYKVLQRNMKVICVSFLYMTDKEINSVNETE
jgi:phosphopantothenate synthetase